MCDVCVQMWCVCDVYDEYVCDVYDVCVQMCTCGVCVCRMSVCVG